MLVLIMAGGIGERFWPQSRTRRPKQLLDLTGEGSMIKLTVERANGLVGKDRVFIITSSGQLEGITKEVPEIPRENVFVEPYGRNTAPCIGVASEILRYRFGDEPVLVLPSDHIVRNKEKFVEAVRVAEDFVTNEDVLLTFGIKPSRPETGYGYIRVGSILHEDRGIKVFESRGFFEKPDAARAGQYLADGDYYWNSGMFLWRTEVILDSIARSIPDLSNSIKKLLDTSGPIPEALYDSIQPQSIDYGVMEKAGNVVILCGDFYWNDIGNWESVREIFNEDENGNVTIGDHVMVEAKNNTIFSRKRLVGLVGVDNLVVVDGDGAILVCDRGRAQDVRRIVEYLRKNGKTEFV